MKELKINLITALRWLQGLFFLVTGRAQSFTGYQCPWCGHDHGGDTEYIDFEPVNHGEYYGSEHTSCWAEGIATCPDCGYKWDFHVVSD